ncbi:MAG: NAD(P)/FAD-dependent oxidoreductase [Coriobacteriales bacterium]|nr:NAD(P)/FAD-dependent oxidoreductase [Coriobacteriales bacterium]
MPKKDSYDLIVVGAGPGGASAAIIAAKAGLDVLLVERATVPGEKNMSGSVLFRELTESIFPGFQAASIHDTASSFASLAIKWSIDNDEKEYGVHAGVGSAVMDHQIIVDRSVADAWCAQEAVNAGAEPLYATRVDDVIWEKPIPGGMPRVIGIVTDKGERIYGKAVADASGLHSNLARKTGLVRYPKDKFQFAVKMIFELPADEIRRRFGFWTGASGLPTYDWGLTPVYFGSNPDFYAAHCNAIPDENVIEVVLYSNLTEMIEADTNIWQRMQWFLETQKHWLEGAKPIHVNFHALNTFDIVGYQFESSYLPGYVLIGDAGGFANPVESWGANVAQYQGRLFAELVAEMKENNDWSEAAFARYEEGWKNSFVGDDDISPMCYMFRDGTFKQLWLSLDEAVSAAVALKFTNHPYCEILPAFGPPFAPFMAKAVGLVSPLAPLVKGAEHGLAKLKDITNIVQKIKD